MDDIGSTRLRLDKWLWAARFYKTRALAVKAIDAGQVRVDDQRAKPSQAMRVGQRIAVRKSGLTVEVEVTGLSDRRGGAVDAASLYAETPESVEAREAFVAARRAAEAAHPRFAGRPTKRERRKLEDFLNEP